MTRSMMIMNGSGHSSFGWDAADDEWVLPMIRKKIAEGWIFRHVTAGTMTVLERVEDIGDSRLIAIEDRDARELFEKGKIGIVNETSDLQAGGRIRSAEEVVRSDTLAHRPLRGG